MAALGRRGRASGVAPATAGLAGPPSPDRTTCVAGPSRPLSDATQSANATTLVAPEGTYDRLRNASAVAAAADAGMLTRVGEDEPVATGDVLVHRFSFGNATTRLLDRLAATNRTSPTAAFRALAGGPGLAFSYYGPTACPPELALNETIERGALRVVPDRANGRLYLVVDLQETAFEPPGGGEPRTHRMDGFHSVYLELTPESGLVGTAVGAGTTFHEYPPGASIGTRGVVRLAPGPNRTVRGQTTFALGTDLRVRLRPLRARLRPLRPLRARLRPADAPTGPLTATATVDREGNFTARFDLSGVGDALYVLDVAGTNRREGRPLLVAVGNATGAVLYVSILSTSGLVKAHGTTTHGGFLVVRNASGSVVARTRYFEPGDGLWGQFGPRSSLPRNGTVSVVVYRDVDGDREFDRNDRPYRVNGSIVRATASVTFPDVEAMPTPTPTPTPWPTASPAPGTTPSASPTATPDPARPVPGPGPAAVAVALLVAALATRRW